MTLTKQLKHTQEIQDKLNLNVVSCGQCEAVIIHDRQAELITCHQCNFGDEPCHFPDLFY
jgi:hypothetical protein